jgi:glutathione S-transferase
MLKVYGRANSINVRKVLWMLAEIGLEYEREDWGRGFKSTEDPAFRKINPVGVVPVIDDGNFRLRESNTIVRYLADKEAAPTSIPRTSRHARRSNPGWTGPPPSSPAACAPSSRRWWSRTRRPPA